MIAWEFVVPSEHRDAFVRAYGPGGDWAALFDRAPGFRSVSLLADAESPGRFLTLDRWVGEAAFRAFRADPALAAAYDALDRACAGWTTRETRLGAFDEAGT